MRRKSLAGSGLLTVFILIGCPFRKSLFVGVFLLAEVPLQQSRKRLAVPCFIAGHLIASLCSQSRGDASKREQHNKGLP